MAEPTSDAGAQPLLSVMADLRFSVTAPNGRQAAGSVTADGGTVHLRTDQPGILIRAVGSGDRARTATVGQLLSDGGLTVQVSGPRGPVARFGAGVDSRLGGLLAGSRVVDVRGIVVTTWRGAAPRLVAAAAGLGVLAVLISRLRGGRRG